MAPWVETLLGPVYTTDHELGPWKMLYLWSEFMGQIPWSKFLKNQFTKFLGPSLGVIRMWTMKNDHAQQNEGVDLFNICPTDAVLGKKKTRPTLTCFLHLLSFHFIIWFCLFSPRISAMDERKRNIGFLLGLYMFCTWLWSMLWQFKHWFCKENGKNLQFWVWLTNYGRRERSIWSQERMAKLVDRLLLGSWTEK